MAAPDIVMYEEEFNQIKTVISKLRIDANAKVVFLVDKNGQQIAAQGEIENLDTTSLASLTAGNVAATDGLARLIGEKEFSILFHEGERTTSTSRSWPSASSWSSSSTSAARSASCGSGSRRPRESSTTCSPAS